MTHNINMCLGKYYFSNVHRLLKIALKCFANRTALYHNRKIIPLVQLTVNWVKVCGDWVNVHFIVNIFQENYLYCCVKNMLRVYRKTGFFRKILYFANFKLLSTQLFYILWNLRMLLVSLATYVVLSVSGRKCVKH